jgi:hypothetical protein
MPALDKRYKIAQCRRRSGEIIAEADQDAEV